MLQHKRGISRLRDLVKLQRTETHGQVFTKSSVDTTASELMKAAGVTRGKSEIAAKVDGFIQYILSTILRFFCGLSFFFIGFA